MDCPTKAFSCDHFSLHEYNFVVSTGIKNSGQGLVWFGGGIFERLNIRVDNKALFAKFFLEPLFNRGGLPSKSNYSLSFLLSTQDADLDHFLLKELQSHDF